MIIIPHVCVCAVGLLMLMVLMMRRLWGRLLSCRLRNSCWAGHVTGRHINSCRIVTVDRLEKSACRAQHKRGTGFVFRPDAQEFPLRTNPPYVHIIIDDKARENNKNSVKDMRQQVSPEKTKARYPVRGS